MILQSCHPSEPTMVPVVGSVDNTLPIGSVEPKEGVVRNKEARVPFPCKVYEMLEGAEEQGFNHIVSWNKEGNGFMVHNKDAFTKEIIPKYYNQTRYKSFQRQLSLYGFQRTTAGSHKGLRFHEKLRRGLKDLCREMKPVGYKPRGQDKREKESVQVFQTAPPPQPVTMTQPPSTDRPSIPAVVSSNSIFQDAEQAEEPVSIFPQRQSQNVEITERLVSTDSVGFFEGMPFYLMTTSAAPTKAVVEPIITTTPQRTTAPPATPENGSNQAVDGQMKKAWEIGFAVAMTMAPPSFVPNMDVPSIDELDGQALQF